MVEGEFDKGIETLQICHPRLEMLNVTNINPFLLVLDCPSLLDLSVGVDSLDEDCTYFPEWSTAYAPSLNCPRLTSLHLLTLYAHEHTLDFVAVHAPNIQRLRACVYEKSPFCSLMHFKALLDLTLLDVFHDIYPH